MIPDKFIRIELRSIGRQKMDMKARVLPQELSDTACAVWQTAVPEKHHMSSKMTEQVCQELDDLQCTNVLIGVKPTVQSQTSLSG